MADIKFGTDGWRALMGREFTVANVQRVAQAAAQYFLEKFGTRPSLLLGYDTRFQSEYFAAKAAEVFCGNGLRVLLTPGPAPTPSLSWGVKHFKTSGAVIITSSHNPAPYSGFKVKSEFGGSAAPEATRRIEELIDRQAVLSLPLDRARSAGLLAVTDPAPAYLNKITGYVDLDLIRSYAQHLVFDPQYGSGLGYLQAALSWKRRTPGRCRVHSIHDHRDPLFGGLNPEPIAENLADLVRAVKRQRAHMGLALDGDADRIGVVDDRGRYVTSHKVLALLLRHFVRNRGRTGPVAKTISGTFLVDRMCEKYGLPLRETPIGFKYVGELILREKFMLGGEESGGMGFEHYLPERDGILTCLLLLEMTARERQPLSRLIRELTREFGPFYYHRVDVSFPLEKRAALLQSLIQKPPASLDRVRVSAVKDFDGVKFILQDGSWLLIRPSGTEPIVRIYSESPVESRVHRLLAIGKKIVFSQA